MPNYTTNLNLVKPLVTENYDIAKVTNENADIIDDALHDLDVDKQDELISGTNIKTVNGNSLLGGGDLVIITSSDWNAISATLTYASADSPTFVANTSIDLTSLISVGMKLKLTQTTVKYFIVTAITSTTITLYGGTDYTLENATITLPYFSSMKAPYRFPLNPDKWSVTFTDSTDRSQASPVNNTWYNLGSLSATLPIGIWNINWKIWAYFVKATTSYSSLFTCVSTSNNSSSDAKFITSFAGYGNTVASVGFTSIRQELINITVKTNIYFNCMSLDSAATIQFLNSQSALLFRAVCAYL